jgi:hypothetical protein
VDFDRLVARNDQSLLKNRANGLRLKPKPPTP